MRLRSDFIVLKAREKGQEAHLQAQEALPSDNVPLTPETDISDLHSLYVAHKKQKSPIA